MDPTVSYAADPFGDRYAWRSDLLRSAEAFLDADDALKRANEEVGVRPAARGWRSR